MTDVIRRGVAPRIEHPVLTSQRPRKEPRFDGHSRVRVRGKFLYAENEKLFIRGVTYGTFRPDESGCDYRYPVVERDFALMAENGVNTVRTYTVPPRWLLDAAMRHGLYVLVGVPWEQHISFLESPGLADDIAERVVAAVRGCARHPAVLGYAIGNEIPSSIVRWHGKKQIERFIERLYRVAKAEDPDALVTYVNYPSTEYLDLPFIDFTCFNIFLESKEAFEAYLARVQNLSGERPLVVTELGLDSQSHGEDGQAEALDWQIRSSFAGGCAGVFVFSWTDDWYRGGADIGNWSFGLTDRDRCPKPALATVRRAYEKGPFPDDLPWPSISVVVCTHNGARLIDACLDGIEKIDYPDYEVLVVDDGSTDGTGDIARRRGFRVISTPHRGLSAARNTGLAAARGEIVAYTDDDASPDPHWLRYLAYAFMNGDHAGVGGPNIPPLDSDEVEECVGRAPGGPTHVLLSDREAEHIPGCNCAFRADRLAEIGGFDTQFWAAGDDVDVCWRLHEKGWTLGFHPSALVWHRPRGDVSAYWRQQVGYGRAEALLERKWPEKYNGTGQAKWAGRLYRDGRAGILSWLPQRVYHGTWGSAPFQTAEPAEEKLLLVLPLMPEWYVLVAVLATLTLLGVMWQPLAFFAILVVLALAIPVGLAWVQAGTIRSRRQTAVPAGGLRRRILLTLMHALHPLARLKGRFDFGLTPWRRRGTGARRRPVPTTVTLWSEAWHAPEEWLLTLERRLRARGMPTRRGGAFGSWDLEVPGGLLGATRAQMAIEEHGSGKQLARFRVTSRATRVAWLLFLPFAGLALRALLDSALLAAVILGFVAIAVTVRTFEEMMCSSAEVIHALRAPRALGGSSGDGPTGTGPRSGSGPASGHVREPSDEPESLTA